MAAALASVPGGRPVPGQAPYAAPRVATGTPPSTAERVVPNDNRVPAGRRHEGVPFLALVARVADWHPDGDAAPGAPMLAFAEEGGPARIPGPLVRGPAGTAMRPELRFGLPPGGSAGRTAVTAAVLPICVLAAALLVPGDARPAWRTPLPQVRAAGARCAR